MDKYEYVDKYEYMDKYEYVDKYQSNRSSSICPLGDPNNYTLRQVSV